MNAAYSIREATQEDLPQLKDFLQEIVAAERPMDPTLKSGHIEYYDPADFLNDENGVVMVAQVEDKLVGCGAAQICSSKHYYTHKHHVHLAMMYVEEAHRGKGVNGAIMEALKTWGMDRGVSHFQLTVYPDNPSAIRAYEKMGFKTALLQMRMDG